MAELSGYRSDASACADEFCVFHEDDVRTFRTLVNVESVRCVRDYADMADKPTLGDQLRDLQERSGLSYDAIAKKAGYRGRSSVQRYFSSEYDAEYLPRGVAERFAKAFDGSAVSKADLMALAGLPEGNASVFQLEGAALSPPRDLPVYGTALGAPKDFDGNAIEQTTLNRSDVIGYLTRPPVLQNVQSAYGLYVQGESMSPRFEDGETIYVTDSRNTRPPRVSEDVVVYVRNCEEDDGETAAAVLVKRLVRRTGTFIELRQFNPPITFKIEADRVLRLDRVVPWSEIVS